MKLGFLFILSGKRVSNPRPAAWEAAALPTELLPHWLSSPHSKAAAKVLLFCLPPTAF